jgi:hypothetical protein
MIAKLLILRIAGEGGWCNVRSRVRVSPGNPGLLLISGSTLEANGRESRPPSRSRQRAGTGLVVTTGQKKSPSDGQGRVAHRRGSRFYTTILRVVKELNTGSSRKFRDAENCFCISTVTGRVCDRSTARCQPAAAASRGGRMDWGDPDKGGAFWGASEPG